MFVSCVNVGKSYRYANNASQNKKKLVKETAPSLKSYESNEDGIRPRATILV